MKKTVAEFLEFNYEKLKLLKRSERGEVWLASNRSGELVIIKCVELTGLPYDTMKNFAFTLPAKIFFCAADETDTVVVEEFIQGENLLERLEEKNFLSESQAREILLQMCDGLHELHAQKIIHRDIKPSNMILQGGRIRLIDFDAARIFKDGKEVDTKLLGTRGYAPPEQFGSGQTDPRSDIYSLGVTVKELLGSNCGGQLKKILDKCTELDPKNRFQNVDELKAALTANSSRWKILAVAVAVTAIGIFLWNASIADKLISTPVAEENFFVHDEEFPLSIGELRLGDSIDTMQKILGNDYATATLTSPNHFRCEYKGLTVTFADGKIIGLISSVNSFATERGITYGSTLNEVFAAYGNRCSVYEGEGLMLYEYPFESAQGNWAVLRFAVSGNFVRYISLRPMAAEERDGILSNISSH